jgi:hypothetical protein
MLEHMDIDMLKRGREKMVIDILEDEIIHPNKIAFFSLVILVRNKDKLCLDYNGELNKITLKEKFPILVIEELLDDLYGAIYFTKLDIH